MLSIYETPLFIEDADRLWSDTEHSEFCFWMAQNPEAGDVVRGSGGCRKVRWSRAGTGKSGGVRIIYFLQLEEGEICMLLIYSKSVESSIPGHILKQVKEEVVNGRKKNIKSK